MRLTLVACGSRGDHQPFLPLAVGLERAGHDVTVMCDALYADGFTRRGLAVDQYRMVEHWSSHLARWHDPASAMDALSEMAEQTAAHAIPALLRAYERSDAVITGGMLLAAATVVRRHVPRPTVVVQLSPLGMWRGDSSYPASDSRRSVRNTGAVLRHLRTLIPSLEPPARAATTYLGDPWRGRRSMLAVLRRSASTPQFYAVSPRVAPAFAGHARTPATGFLRPEDPGPAEQGLEAFLESGPAPLFLGLGSATEAALRDRFAALVTAALDAGERVVTTRATGLAEGDFPLERVHLVGETPFDDLFPRCSLIVHHGGSGTTASALAAGVPQFVTPLAMDQPYFGRRMRELGVGVSPVPFPEVGPNDLKSAIGQAPSLAPRAAELGRLERATDGVANAVGFLRRILGPDG